MDAEFHPAVLNSAGEHAFGCIFDYASAFASCCRSAEDSIAEHIETGDPEAIRASRFTGPAIVGLGRRRADHRTDADNDQRIEFHMGLGCHTIFKDNLW